jgi:ABC-type multidrug transport system permease subunit
VSGAWLTAVGVARRQLRRVAKNPPLLLPAVLFPLLLFASFAGGLTALGLSPEFDYPDYTTFQFVYILMQAAAVAGMQTGLAIAEDFESGFARRMMLATRSRWPLVVGYALAAVVRGVLVIALLFPVGLLAGMEVSGSVLQVAGVIVLILAFDVVVTLWCAGFAFRLRSLKAGALFQVPVLIVMFLVPVYTTRPLLADWLETAADYNPLTAVLEAARGLMVGDPVSVGLAFGISAGLLALLVVWVGTSLRKAETAGA